MNIIETLFGFSPDEGSGALEGAAILAQRDLPFGAAIDVIEHRARQPPSRRAPEILDVHNPRGGNVHNFKSTTDQSRCPAG